MKSSAAAGAAVLALFLGAQPGAAYSPAVAPSPAPDTAALDEEPDCEQVPPERTPLPVSDGGEKLPLTATVLVAQADLGAARERLTLTQQIFETAAVDLRVTFQAIKKKVPTFAGTTGDKHRAAIQYAKQQVGGTRPKAADVVLFLSPQFDGSGFADCVGGIGHADRAFAVGGLRKRQGGPSNLVDGGTVAAHEIGHLLGAQHHYGNCVEAQPRAFLQNDQDLNACTLMFQFSITPKVGTLESAYIRDYVRTYGQHVRRKVPRVR